MEGKTVILGMLIMSMVMAQTRVEAIKSCCPDVAAREKFNKCRIEWHAPRSLCGSISGCKLLDNTSETKCPPGFLKDNLENFGDAVNEYCKLGCASSMCGSMITIQNFDAREIVNEAVKQCTNACSTLCNKGFVETA